MATYSNGEAYGAKAFTWTIIAASALLLVEVTWPQAMPAPAMERSAAQTVTVEAHGDRLARAN
jgi:hypothetical protein